MTKNAKESTDKVQVLSDLLKNQKDREQILKDKYNVSSISPAERRDLQQIILKKQEITDDDRNWLEKLSSKQD